MSTSKSLHRAYVDTDVFAAIWCARKPGEDTENDVLRRIYGLPPAAHETVAVVTAQPSSKSAPATSRSKPTVSRQSSASALETKSIVHHEANADFPGGFVIFRGFEGQTYHAQVVEGGWRLQDGRRVYGSLVALNKAIGAIEPNVWMAWYYHDSANKRRPLDDYRLGAR